MSTCGAEIEKPISDIRTGLPRGVSQKFFGTLLQTIPGSQPCFSDIKPRTVIAVDGLGGDNGFNLQETSTCVSPDLHGLEKILKTDLQIVQEALAEEGLTAINMSIHPLGKTDRKSYSRFVAPKGVYRYISQRGWDHAAGIDARAQNSPCTGVEAYDAAKALTTVIGASAAIIGIFANSPFEGGGVSAYKETRLRMWERFMKNSIAEGDRATAKFPEKPFSSLRDYFYWMFGPGTSIHFVMASGSNYKTFGDGAILIDGNPPVLDYLASARAQGRYLVSGKMVTVEPTLGHMQALQFAQFTSARIRWTFDRGLEKARFLQSLKENTLERLFSEGGANNVYIEGRDPGANFPDKFLGSIDPNLAWSTLVAPSAIQYGLIRNLAKASDYVRTFDWKQLKVLRDSAIKDGLDGRAGDLGVGQFAQRVLGLAAEGLPAHYHRFLAYPEYVLRTGKNGADRSLDAVSGGKSLADIVKSRNVVIP